MSLGLSFMLPRLVALTVGLAYLNVRYVRMHTTMAMMGAGMLLAGSIAALGWLHPPWHATAVHLVDGIDFNAWLLDGMLGYLLFAGSLHINIEDFKASQSEIMVLAGLGTLVSTVLIGVGTRWVMGLAGVDLSWSYAMLFGALISPTDPIAVLSTLRDMKAPPSIAIKMAGESLFNDGVGVVLFTTFLGWLHHPSASTDHLASDLLWLFFQQAVGGIAYGYVCGHVTKRMIRNVCNEPILCVMISLAMVTLAYPLAHTLGVSGPLAMVVAGMVVGHLSRFSSMPNRTQAMLVNTWHTIDELLNALVFLLLGLELILLQTTAARYHVPPLAILAVVVAWVLAVRYLTVAWPMRFLRLFRGEHHPATNRILVWGGLRGGLAVALVLAIPPSPHRDTLLWLTYGVVLFSVLVQGSTVKHLIPPQPATSEQLEAPPS